MDIGIPVEERRWRKLILHGIAAGICAGMALGLVQFVISAAQQQGALSPFRLVASLALGAIAFQPQTPTALLMTVGTVLHLALAALFGVVFVALLALAFQLSARTWMLIGYGLLFGFLLWEVNFLAILPGLYPDLVSHFGLVGQVWNGIVAYTLVYGPLLALYMALMRPCVLSDWNESRKSAFGTARNPLRTE
jgi:hypothetical protein